LPIDSRTKGKVWGGEVDNRREKTQKTGERKKRLGNYLRWRQGWKHPPKGGNKRTNFGACWWRVQEVGNGHRNEKRKEGGGLKVSVNGPGKKRRGWGKKAEGRKPHPRLSEHRGGKNRKNSGGSDL